ncbi:hypothetical protein BD770DRAFT_435582 [Pilaira anomala]|nr:hypothetical protein BD770DRAFT_435582 [Pilaira anomala]
MTMFDIPKKTLLESLNTLLERPKEYLADVCFVFESIEIWAHRAVILARAPKELIERYFPELKRLEEKKQQIRIDMNDDNAVKISVQLFRPLLRFWYTASYYPIHHTSEKEEKKKMQEALEKLGIQLGTAVLPVHCESVPDFIQLEKEIKAMREDESTMDVKISVRGKPPPQQQQQQQQPSKSIRAHKCILAAQSAYFYALFCTEFQESSTEEIEMNQELFNEAILDLMVTFFYTDKVIVSELQYDHQQPFSFLQRKLQQQKHALRVIQKAFYAADYLGHDETLGRALLHAMESMCHQFKCACIECAGLLPSMLAWSDKHVEVVPKLRRTLILLYSDPVQSLPLLWSQRPFSLLVTTFVPNTVWLGQNTLASVLKGEALFRERTPKTLIHDILERLFCNITKHNAIHVLHALHLCQSHLRTADPKPTWSRPTLDLVKPVLEYTVDKICQSLDFYCGEYPILLSCVDGIGAGFSIDFLDFLLRHVLHQGIHYQNAGVIYQVIVRDLSGRQEVVKNMAIDDVLIKARKRCATFIGQHWSKIKAQDGFRVLDKSILRVLAEEIHIPYRNLTNKTYDTTYLFSSFSSSSSSSFSSKKSVMPVSHNKKVTPEDKHALLNKVYTRRLSLGNLMTKSSGSFRTSSRPRALSTETVSGMTRYHPPPVPTLRRALENPPLINLLSQETDERRKALEEADHQQQQQQQQKKVTRPPSFRLETNRPLLRTSSSFTSLTDQLLPIEGMEEKMVVPTPQARTTRLKFELPTAPARRSTSPNRNLPSSESFNTFLTAGTGQGRSRRGSKSRMRKTRWSMGSDVSDEEESSSGGGSGGGSGSSGGSGHSSLPALGNKIELLRRPLPTMGTIKYIGPVQFAEGTYIGVELESRLGKSDGSVDGIRYFFTDPQRALFVKPDDFKILE